MDNEFTIASLETEEIVRLVVVTFPVEGNSRTLEFVTVGAIKDREFFENFLKDQDIGWLTVQEFRVETFSGMGGAYRRTNKNTRFKPIDW